MKDTADTSLCRLRAPLFFLVMVLVCTPSTAHHCCRVQFLLFVP